MTTRKAILTGMFTGLFVWTALAMMLAAFGGNA